MSKMKFKHVNEESFSQIRKLLDAGLSMRQVTSFTGVCVNTVWNVSKVKTLAAYKEMVAAHNLKRKGKAMPTLPEAKPSKQEKTSETPVYDVLVEIRDLINDTNRILAMSGKAKGFRLF